MRRIFSTAVVTCLFVAFPRSWASSIQQQPPEKIFAAICATCHGPTGLGGNSWVDGMQANKIAGLAARRVSSIVRAGLGDTSMPAFGPERLSNAELAALAKFIEEHPNGVPAPKPPPGDQVVVNMLDADPWYRDDSSDLAPDTRRVQLSPNQYLKIVNTGKTWHTVTADELARDSGYIGPNQYRDSGYYYADQATDLFPGCVDYHCHIHPYMHFEVCSGGSTPRGLTRASKNPLKVPDIPGKQAELWVMAQTQEEDASDPTDGAIQVIDTQKWEVSSYIPDTGNNTHFGWPGKNAAGNEMVISTSFHDNFLTYIDPETKKVVSTAPDGAAVAHVMASPGLVPQWLTTLNGANGLGRIDPMLLRQRMPANIEIIRASQDIQEGPHGLWFCDDGDHVITANMFSESISLFSLTAQTQLGFVATDGKLPMNPIVMSGYDGGCRRAFVANLSSNTLTVLDIDTTTGTISKLPLTGPLADNTGNLKLQDISVQPVRWAKSTIQTSVSPPNATTHGRYIIVPSKMSFLVSIIKLDADGMPAEIFNFPSGIGSHGIGYSKKSVCDSGNPDDVCYYAYVGNSYDDYVGVYDLERIENGRMGPPGLSLETVRLEGELVDRLCGFYPDELGKTGISCDNLTAGPIGRVIPELPIKALCPDCRGGVHVGDIPLRLTTQDKYSYFKSSMWIDLTTDGDGPAQQFEADLELKTNTGVFNVFTRPLPPPWGK